jgi:hypothetical protein
LNFPFSIFRLKLVARNETVESAAMVREGYVELDGEGQELKRYSSEI